MLWWDNMWTSSWRLLFPLSFRTGPSGVCGSCIHGFWLGDRTCRRFGDLEQNRPRLHVADLEAGEVDHVDVFIWRAKIIWRRGERRERRQREETERRERKRERRQREEREKERGEKEKERERREKERESSYSILNNRLVKQIWGGLKEVQLSH